MILIMQFLSFMFTLAICTILNGYTQVNNEHSEMRPQASSSGRVSNTIRLSLHVWDAQIIMKSLEPLRAKKIFIRKKLGHTAVSAIKASSVAL